MNIVFTGARTDAHDVMRPPGFCRVVLHSVNCVFRSMIDRYAAAGSIPIGMTRRCPQFSTLGLPPLAHEPEPNLKNCPPSTYRRCSVQWHDALLPLQ